MNLYSTTFEWNKILIERASPDTLSLWVPTKFRIQMKFNTKL